MNGVFEIQTESGIVKLRMNYYASMEFEQAFFRNASGNSAKIFTDLVFAGLYGEASISGSKMPEQLDARRLVAEISERDDFDEISVKIWDIYNESKWGKDFKKRIDEFAAASKKKVEVKK